MNSTLQKIVAASREPTPFNTIWIAIVALLFSACAMLLPASARAHDVLDWSAMAIRHMTSVSPLKMERVLASLSVP